MQTIQNMRPSVPPQRRQRLENEAARAAERFQAGELMEAERLARRVLRRHSRHGLAAKVLAASLAGLGNWDAALALYEQSIVFTGADWQFLNNYGNALKTVGRQDEAERMYRRAVQMHPGVLEPHYNLGLNLMELGRLEEAAACLEQALRLDPRHGMTHLNLANVFNVQGRLEAAEQHYRAALAVLPADARLLNNLGQLLAKRRNFAEAEACYRQALQIDPAYATAYSNLSELMAAHGYPQEAVTLLRHAIKLEPQHAQAHSNLLFTLGHVATGMGGVTAERRAFAARFETPLRALWQVHPNERDPERALRVGFVSADLRDHPVVRYLRPTLERLCRRQDMVLVAYNNSTLQPDADTAMYRELFHEWHDVAHLEDAVLAERVQRDGIDMLVDLSGHTGHNRLLTFARKPAPVQVSWMGYVGSTGLAAMDYFVADPMLIPPEMDREFSEKLLLVPAATSFEPVAAAPAVQSLPALTTGVFTFGCLARLNKLNRRSIFLWAEILRRVPDSRLLLAAMPDGSHPAKLLEWFAEEGIGPERLAFGHARGVEQVLALHHHIDLALDTFPYNGSTGNNHALWMGVPTLTLTGATPPGRMGTALALGVGLPEFVAASESEFIARAVWWAGRQEELGALRLQLRERFAASVFQQHDLVAQCFAEALRMAWRRWCAGLEPETQTVSPG